MEGTGLDLQLKRKLWHVVTGLVALLVTFILKFDSYDAAFAAFIVGLAGLIFELFRFRFEKLNVLFFSIAGGVLRERERRQLSGFTYYCFGVSLTFFLFPWKLAILAILFLIFADPFASLVGLVYGKIAFWRGKSIEGTFACFLLCCLLSGLYCYSHLDKPVLAFAFLGGVAGAVSEMVAFLDDNFSLPVFSGFFLTQIYLFL